MGTYWQIFTDSNRPTNVLIVRRPPNYEDALIQSRQRFLFGMSSCHSFPKGWDQVVDLCRGWCHCFRNPETYIHSATIPKLLLSESDFCDTTLFKPRETPKKFDFFYSMKGGHQKKYKNYDLFLQSIPVLVGKMGLNGVLVGCKVKIPAPYRSKVKVIGLVGSTRMVELLNSSKVAFFPNLRDASPRVLAEALSTNVPAVVNQNIYGGWKYINEWTGTFFQGVDDLEQAFLRVLNNPKLDPRKWFKRHYGIPNSGRRLYEWIKSIEPKATPAKYYVLR